MRDRRAGRGGVEHGFTLLELTVALTILAVGIAGVAQVMGGAFRTAGAGRSRARAVSVATAEIEALRAVPYAQLLVSPGVSESDVHVGGGTYHVRRAVTWANDGSVVNAFKAVTVEVTWSDESGAHEVHQSSLVYPGGLGAVVSVPTPIPGTPGQPGILVAVPVPVVGGVELTWTPPLPSNPPPASYVVQYSTDTSFATYQQVTSELPAAAPLALVGDLAPDTTYHFRVASEAANGNRSGWTTTNNVHTAASTATTCRVGAATVTPPAVTKAATGGLGTNPVVTAPLIGACSATTLTAVYEPLDDGVTVSTPLGGSGAVRSSALEGTGRPWAVGRHKIDLVDGAGVKRATVRLVVCDTAAVTCG